MDRQTIHIQIQQLTDKIARLNYNLKGDEALHAVEIDLLKSYAAELNKLVDLLEGVVGSHAQASVKVEQVQPEPEQEEEVEPASKIAVEEARKSEPEEAIETEEELEEMQKKEVEEEMEVEVKPEEAIVEPAPEVAESPVEEQQEVGSPVAEQAQVTEEVNEVEEDDPLVEPVVNEEVEEKGLSLNDRFKHQENDLAHKLKNKPEEDLRHMIDLSEKYEFINELFAGDAIFFDRAIRQLDKCDSYEDAVEYLDTEVRYQVSWEGKERYEEKLMDLLGRRFASAVK